MNQMTEFQQRACAAAVVKLLNAETFYITDLDAIAKTMSLGGSLGGPDYAALRALHCMKWGDMGPDLARLAREKCLEILGLPPQAVEPAVEDSKDFDEAPQRAAKRLRLAFWRA